MKSAKRSAADLEQAAARTFIKGDFERAVTLYVQLAESYQPSGNTLAAAKALREAIQIQYDKLHLMDPTLVLTADGLLRGAGAKDPAAARAAGDFDAELKGRIDLLWKEWGISREQPGDWRKALADPSLSVFLKDIHGHREAQRHLTKMAAEFKSKAVALLEKGGAYETMQAYRAAGEIYLKVGRPLDAAQSFRCAAETAYDRLDRLDPNLIHKAYGAYEAAVRDDRTRDEGERGRREWSRQIQGNVDALWKRLEFGGTPPSWQQAFDFPLLKPYFNDVQGHQAAARQRQEVVQRQIEKKGFFDKLIDGATVVGGVIWDSTKQVVNDVIVEPVQTAVDYYTNPNFSLKQFARDAGEAGTYAVDQAGHAVTGVVKDLTQPLVTAYGYYTDPHFSLQQFVKDVGLAKQYVADWAGGRLDKEAIVPVNPHAKPLDLQQLEKEIGARTGTVASANRVRLYVDGDEAFPALHTMIQSARSSIHVQIYMFDNDRTGYALADALIAKARQGVEVRVLVDKMGSHIVNSSLDHNPGDKGNIIAYLRRNGVTVQEDDNAYMKSDHRKVVIVDGQCGITGGMNFGNCYAEQWHDFMVELHGPAVTRMQTAFLTAWANAGGSVNPKTNYLPTYLPIPTKEAISARVLITTPDLQEIKSAVYAAIERARHHIYVEHAYLTDDEVVEKLVAARRRGVDVRIVIPAESDMAIYDRSNRVSVNRLLEAGAQVYFYKRMIHGKALTVDGQWTTIGSANLSRRSLNANQEMNFALADPGFARWAEQRIFEPDMEPDKSHRVTQPLAEGVWDGILDWLADKATHHI